LLANIIGSGIGLSTSWGAAFYAEYMAINSNQIASQVIVSSVLGSIFGLINGAIVGGGLIWVLWQSRLEI
jgi:hypothetical protein